MKVSVIIPVYNVEKYIHKCLYSVLENNLDTADYEIIVVDDESSDSSVAIVETIALKHTNIKIIAQKNKGLGGARNTGISNARGAYLLFLDSDDWYVPNTLKELLAFAAQQSVDIIEFGAQGILENGAVIYTKSQSSNQVVFSGIDYYQRFRYMDSACNKLYKKSFLEENNLTFLERLYIEDYEFNTRVFYLARNVMAVDLIVGQFLQSPNSITRTSDRAKRVKMTTDIIAVIKRVNDLKITDNQQNTAYFEQRLGYLTVLLFFQLVKDQASYAEFKVLKSSLQQQHIFFNNYLVFDKKKELFRKVFLKNFAMFRLLLFARRLL